MLRIFGPKRDEVTGKWRKLHNEELKDFYSSPNTGRFITFSMITKIYNKKTKGPTLMELFTATGKLNFFCGN